jgi:hypothetical protein
VLLLNLIRVLVTLLTLTPTVLVIGYFHLTTWPALLVASIGMFGCFVAGDLAEARLIELFNPPAKEADSEA